MKILVTGASGTLGTAIREAAGATHELVCMDVSEAVESIGGIRASVTDADAVADAARGCDAILHTAAMHGQFRDKASNADFIRTNVIGTEHVFAAALKHGIRRVVFSSTMGIFVGYDWTASGRVELDETSPPRPDWVYPLTKLMCEQMGSHYARQHGLEVVSLRYMALTERSVEDTGFGLLARALTARDAAVANLLAATRPGLFDHVLNLGPDTPLRQRDINDADKPFDVLERHWPGCTELLQRRGKTPPRHCLWPVTRIDRAKAVLGWKPESRFDRFLASLGWTGAPQPARADA